MLKFSMLRLAMKMETGNYNKLVMKLIQLYRLIFIYLFKVCLLKKLLIKRGIINIKCLGT